MMPVWLAQEMMMAVGTMMTMAFFGDIHTSSS